MAETKKPWRWAARIAALPPIDWAALAIAERAASRRTRKGDKRPLADVMAQLASWERNRRAKQQAAWRELRRTWHPLAYRHRQFNSVFTLAHRIALAMEPGRWYGKGDVERMTGLRRTSIKARVSTMWRAGYLRRVRNPDWHPARQLPGEGVDMMPLERHAAPTWLYGLTATGEALRREAEYLA